MLSYTYVRSEFRDLGSGFGDDTYTDGNGIERYNLDYLKTEGSGTILPSIGIIVEF